MYAVVILNDLLCWALWIRNEKWNEWFKKRFSFTQYLINVKLYLPLLWSHTTGLECRGPNSGRAFLQIATHSAWGRWMRRRSSIFHTSWYLLTSLIASFYLIFIVPLRSCHLPIFPHKAWLDPFPSVANGGIEPSCVKYSFLSSSFAHMMSFFRNN